MSNKNYIIFGLSIFLVGWISFIIIPLLSILQHCILLSIMFVGIVWLGYDLNKTMKQMKAEICMQYRGVD